MDTVVVKRSFDPHSPVEILADFSAHKANRVLQGRSSIYHSNLLYIVSIHAEV